MCYFLYPIKMGTIIPILQDFYRGVYEIIYVKCLVFKKIFLVHFYDLIIVEVFEYILVNKRDVVPALV